MWVYTWRKRRYNHGPGRLSPREGALLFSTQLINTPKLPQSSATVALTRSWGETPQQLQEENNILSITSWKTWGGGSHINTPTMLHPVYMDLPRIIKKEPLSDPFSSADSRWNHAVVLCCFTFYIYTHNQGSWSCQETNTERQLLKQASPLFRFAPCWTSALPPHISDTMWVSPGKNMHVPWATDCHQHSQPLSEGSGK